MKRVIKFWLTYNHYFFLNWNKKYFSYTNRINYDCFFCSYKRLWFQAELIYRPTTRTVTRLVTYPEPPHHVVRVRVRPSVVLRELDRIAYRRRPAVAVSAVDDFFRSESTKVSVFLFFYYWSTADMLTTHPLQSGNGRL